jgi:quinolinate synthase
MNKDSTLSAKAVIDRVRGLRGDSLTIMGHHYMNDAVIRHCDLRGDSLELARRIPGLDAEHVVFCGVYFMAETAAILAKPGQKIHTPDRSASCIMSNMAPGDLAESVMERLVEAGPVTPLTYVNSKARIKALCGRYGGSVCTSANAVTMLAWALDQGGKALFLPDRNLAANTAGKLGIPESEQLIIDIRSRGQRLDMDAVARARLIIWPGLCAIHHRFKPRHVTKARADNPDARIIVHPESPPEVVDLADASGSTSAIIQYVEDSPPGATIYIGTETNLVKRLARQWAASRTIRPLLHSACANMARITEPGLARLLENLDNDRDVQVDQETAQLAGLALDRMLSACS